MSISLDSQHPQSSCHIPPAISQSDAIGSSSSSSSSSASLD
ncbi:MAG: hypothetical protein WA941_15460 [Nitrososphaeraceae archaeon]